MRPLAFPFAHAAHSFSCSILLASLACSAALFVYSLTHSLQNYCSEKVNNLMSQNQVFLNHSELIELNVYCSKMRKDTHLRYSNWAVQQRYKCERRGEGINNKYHQYIPPFLTFHTFMIAFKVALTVSTSSLNTSEKTTFSMELHRFVILKREQLFNLWSSSSSTSHSQYTVDTHSRLMVKTPEC